MEIFRSWRHGSFEIHIQNYTTLNIQNTHDITSRIFKIPMSLWIFKISMSHIQNYTITIFKIPIFKIPMTSLQNTHDVSFWIFPWRHFVKIQNTNDVTSWIFKMPHLNIRKLSTWVFWTHWSFEYSRSDVMGNLSIHEVRSTVIHADVIGILNIKKLTSWLFWIFTANTMGIVNIHVMGILNTHELPSWEYSKLASWVFWIFIVTLVFWIFLKWRHYYEYSKKT